MYQVRMYREQYYTQQYVWVRTYNPVVRMYYNPYAINEARPRERSDRGCFLSLGGKSLFIMRPFLPSGQKSLFTAGCVQGAIL